MTRPCIAIDMSPVLPGGVNGGAKIFALELVRRLAEILPNTTFLIITNQASHNELAALDNKNISRHLITELSGCRDVSRIKTVLLLIGRKLIGCFSNSTQVRIKRFIRRIDFLGRNSVLKSSMLTGLNVDLLFCPFTRPTFHSDGIPTVSTIYDLQYKKYPDFFEVSDAAQRAENFELASMYSSRMVVISNFTRQEVIDCGMISSEKVKTIYLRMASRGIALDGPDKIFLLKQGIQKGLYLLYPANFWRHKNHELLLLAFAQARSSGLINSTKLVCTGALDNRSNWLRHAANSLGLRDSVIFSGFVTDEEYAQLLINSCGLIFPSLYEGFGLPVVEAMAAGIPVACSNVTSLPEIAGDAAILFDPRRLDEIKNSIISLANDVKLVATLKRRGLERASKFLDAKKMAIEYAEVFQELLNNKLN